jgi:hypothetical protein
MRIAIIGAGSVGATLGRAWIKHGEDVIWGAALLDGGYTRLPDQWQGVILVEGRGRRQCPFQRRCANTPRVGGSFGLSAECVSNTHEKYDQAQGRDVGPDRRDVIPVSKSIGIICNPSRHSGQPQEVLREEREVDADKSEPEVQLAEEFRIGVARHFRKPVVPAGEDGES